MHQTGDSSSHSRCMTFRLGAVGHRFNRLQNANFEKLRKVIHFVLRDVQKSIERAIGTRGQFKPFKSIRYILMSSLAEGSDQMFAQEALNLGFELHALFPFAQREYENDFGPSSNGLNGSVSEFRKLLQVARKRRLLTTTELQGNRTDSGAAYAAASESILSQSDLLIAIWDGGGPEGKGGTYDSMLSAMEKALPTIWIDACSPHQPHELKKYCKYDGSSVFSKKWKAGQDRLNIDDLILNGLSLRTH